MKRTDFVKGFLFVMIVATYPAYLLWQEAISNRAPEASSLPAVNLDLEQQSSADFDFSAMNKESATKEKEENDEGCSLSDDLKKTDWSKAREGKALSGNAGCSTK